MSRRAIWDPNNKNPGPRPDAERKYREALARKIKEQEAEDRAREQAKKDKS
jgi:hypothetical protein